MSLIRVAGGVFGGAPCLESVSRHIVSRYLGTVSVLGDPNFRQDTQATRDEICRIVRV